MLGDLCEKIFAKVHHDYNQFNRYDCYNHYKIIEIFCGS